MKEHLKIHFQDETGTSLVKEEIAKKALTEVIDFFKNNNWDTKMIIEISIMKDDLTNKVQMTRFYFRKEENLKEVN